jgi:xanthine dehydrogenase accessory factor
MISPDIASRSARLDAERVPYVLATVVGAHRPTSVRQGDRALVLGDGTIEGFVGGTCAESSVRLHALRALETGDPLLLRLVPDEGASSGVLEGAVVEHNPCLSGGTLEIFLEPCLPALRVVVVGDAPVARAVASVATAAGYDVAQAPPSEVSIATGDGAVIVATHGAGEEEVLSEALSRGVPYVALVASARRGAAVRAALDVPEELRELLHTPAGLNIGARVPGEIAISILAELVACQHAQPGSAAAGASAHTVEREAVDPVCGMTVAVSDATPRVGDAFFCSERCRVLYAEQHAVR